MSGDVNGLQAEIVVYSARKLVIRREIAGPIEDWKEKNPNRKTRNTNRKTGNTNRKTRNTNRKPVFLELWKGRTDIM